MTKPVRLCQTLSKFDDQFQFNTDSVVHTCEKWLAERYAEQGAIPSVVKLANIPERTLKRRFKVATGSSLIERTQDLRVEEAKCLLEAGTMPVDEISFDVGALAK